MRLILAAVMVGTALFFASGTTAQDKKEVVLKGKITCNKCELNKSTECETVILVKDAKSKKDVTYFFDAASHGKYHDDICSSPKKGTVSGTVKDMDKKKIIAVKKLTYE